MVNKYAEKIPIIELTKPERLWIEKVHEANKSGLRISFQEIWSLLHKQLPPNFRIDKIDPRLIDSEGEKIKILGVIAFEKNYTILEKINVIIRIIKQIILDNPMEENIIINSIAKQSKLSITDISFVLHCLSDFGHFYNGSSYSSDNTILNSINVGRDRQIYYRYIYFTSIEELIILRNFHTYQKPEEHFTFDEKIFLSDKIDRIQNDLNAIKLGQEVIWTDVMEEIGEMKAHFELSKRNWRQLLMGKLSEMVLAGIIDETISRKIVEFINPVFALLLNQ